MNGEKERLRIRFEIVRLYEEGFSQRAISNKMSIPKTTVEYTIQKYSKHKTVMRAKGSGRGKSLNDADREFLKENLSNSPMISANKLSSLLSDRRKTAVSGRTIQRELNSQVQSLRSYLVFRKRTFFPDLV
jgi:transposase